MLPAVTDTNSNCNTRKHWGGEGISLDFGGRPKPCNTFTSLLNRKDTGRQPTLCQSQSFTTLCMINMWLPQPEVTTRSHTLTVFAAFCENTWPTNELLSEGIMCDSCVTLFSSCVPLKRADRCVTFWKSSYYVFKGSDMQMTCLQQAASFWRHESQAALKYMRLKFTYETIRLMLHANRRHSWHDVL